MEKSVTCRVAASSSQIQREREEMERRDLRKMIMDGEAKQKEMKKKQQVSGSATRWPPNWGSSSYSEFVLRFY